MKKMKQWGKTIHGGTKLNNKRSEELLCSAKEM